MKLNFSNKGLIFLLAVFALQLAVPAYMILEQKHTLANGTAFKFKTQPIDPYDPFRGRYVILRLAAQSGNFKIDSEQHLSKGDSAYALIGKDEEGFAKILNVQVDAPSQTQDYVRVELGYGNPERGFNVKLPIDRYYAQEDKAPAIEKAVGRWWRRAQEDNVYVAVRMLNGKATIEELYIKDMPVDEYLMQKQLEREAEKDKEK